MKTTENNKKTYDELVEEYHMLSIKDVEISRAWFKLYGVNQFLFKYVQKYGECVKCGDIEMWNTFNTLHNVALYGMALTRKVGEDITDKQKKIMNIICND